MIKNKVCYFNNEKEKLEVKNNQVYVNNILLSSLGNGVDGYVYKYKDKAIKLYHDDIFIKEHLTKEQINILCNISTKHLVLPKEPLISEEKNSGFVMEFINQDTKKEILSSTISNFIGQTKEIEEELSLIGKNHFLLDDLQPQNIFYNGTLYLFDADSLIYDKKVDFSRKNIEILVWYFIRDIIFSINNELTSKEQLSLVRKLHYIYQKGTYSTLSNLLEEIMYGKTLKDTRSNLLRVLQKQTK